MANEGKYLNLKPHVDSWSIYNVNGPYVTDSRIGTLAPSQFGGLSYQIIEDKGNHVYVIQTESFGKVAIWAGDSDSTFTSSPVYTNGASVSTGGTGLYVNLKPHVDSWSIYNPNGPYVTSSRIGILAPSQFGGLSYEIQGEKGNDVYLIQTESFGLVAIWAGDSDSTFTSVPTYLDPVNGGQGGGVISGTGQYLNLHPHVTSWSIYNVNGPYASASRIGTLAPSQFGGLSYAILGSPTTDVYIIHTESFGQVAIWAGDSDSSITGHPTYAAGSFTGSEGGTADGTYLNLSPTVESWSIYNVNGPYMTSSRIGTLAPSQFGGLSYRILEFKGNNVYIIQTEGFGKVAIWAGDSDSTFTSYPVYGDSSSVSSPGGILDGIDLSVAPISIQPRSEWGASPIQWEGMDGELSTIKYIVIHHTAGAQPQVGTDQTVMRGIQNDHQGRGWGDIGYHFCIGQQGTVMEGRSLPLVGAHVGRPHNFDSIGVSLFGDFSYVKPTDVQLKKLIPLLAYLCQEYDVSPNNILGHRDMDSNYGATACPGDYFYNATSRLGEIRQKVKDYLVAEQGDLEEENRKIEAFMRENLGNTELFRNLPFVEFNIGPDTQEYRIAPNVVLKVDMYKHIIDTDSPIFNLLFRGKEAELDSSILQAIEGELDDVEFFNTKGMLEEVDSVVKPNGNTKLSIGYKFLERKLLVNYEITLHSIPIYIVLAKNPSATIKFTIEIDDYSFIDPKQPEIEIPNEVVVQETQELSIEAGEIIMISLGVVAIGAAFYYGGPVVGKMVFKWLASNAALVVAGA